MMSTNPSEPAGTFMGLLRHAWLVPTLAVLLILPLAIVAGLHATSRQDVSYPPDSPEAAYQGYLHAWDAGDLDGAFALLSDGARASLPEREFHEARRWSGDETRRVWIDEVIGSDDRVTLVVTLESTDRGFLPSRSYRQESRIRMVRDDGAWLIDTPLVGYQIW